MSLTAALRVAIESLFVNKGRSALTSLGIVIGIMAVIAMVAAGGGAREKLDERLESVGKNIIIIQPGSRSAIGVVTHLSAITAEDVQALRDDGTLKTLVVNFAESQPTQGIVSNTTGAVRTTLVGVPPQIFEIRKWQLSYGRFYTNADQKKAATVCLLGETVRKRLFPNKANPVGDRIRINNISLEIIGVLGPKGRAPTGMDQDDQILMPVTTLQDKIAQEKRIALVVGAARSQANIDAAVKRITTILRDRHHIKPNVEDDFSISSVHEMSQLAVFLTNTLNILVVVIASISLVVGGIGIMNIMLVSVTERTREIGIRMAVGATPADVRNQFLIEAVALALVGGLIGTTLGIAVALVITHLLGWPAFISPFFVALAFGVSALVGVFFGFYPAAKASQLDPIEALRYE